MATHTPGNAREETPSRSRRIRVAVDEAFEFLSDPKNLPLWFGGRVGDELHLDAEPSARTVHLRWGAPGMWRHMVTGVAPEEDASRVTITFVPVPGCDGVCLDREILAASGRLSRLARALRDRSHLVDSEGYWT
jgi:hypothetical protein